MLRGYKSDLVKQWAHFVSYYKNQKLHLADYAAEIGQMQGFDIPASNKKIARVRKEVKDLVIREGVLEGKLKTNR